MPVNTMATPWSSAASITSSSRTEPPGWITAVAPASIGDEQAVGEREEGVGGDHRAFGQRLLEAGCLARRPAALRAAMRAESTRLIWPAPMPTVAPSLA